VNSLSAELENDFVIEMDEFSCHVLNCISPGWTCAMPFARHIVDQISTKFRVK